MESATYTLVVNVIREEKGIDLEKMSLYFFKRVETGALVQPTVWMKLNYDNWKEGRNEITWTENYKTYLRTAQLINGEILSNIYKEDIKEEERGVITITNKTDTKQTCGLMQPDSNGIDTPICAIELEGNTTLQMKPCIKLSLFWGSELSDLGTVTSRTFSQGIEVDFGDDKIKTVTFSTKSMWTQTSFTKKINDLGPYIGAI